MITFNEVLREEFTRRKATRTSYSLRCFARDLNCPPSRMSAILKGESGAHAGRATHIADKLQLCGELRQQFIASANTKVKAGGTAQDSVKFPLAKFSIIADWWHVAILEALEHGKSLASNLTSLLGLEGDAIQRAVERLAHLDLVSLDPNGNVEKTSKSFDVADEKSDVAIKHFHSQVSSLAQIAMADEESKRDFSADFMMIDESQIADLKEELANLRKKFSDRARSSNLQNPRMYCLSTQFFDVCRKKVEGEGGF